MCAMFAGGVWHIDASRGKPGELQRGIKHTRFSSTDVPREYVRMISFSKHPVMINYVIE